MKFSFSFLLILLLFGTTAWSQTVVISDDSNNISGDASAVLELKATTKGFLIPRLTASERSSINNPASGLLIYQSDGAQGFYYYTGTYWTSIDSGISNHWLLTGNSSTTAANFLGTTDNVSLRMRTNNTERVIIDSTGQVGIGTSAPSAPLQVTGNNPLKLFGVQSGSSTDSVLTIISGTVKKLPMGYGTAGLWSLTGNTATTAANFFGTTDNVSLRLRTNNTQRVIIDSIGQIGIGTSAPTAPLQVTGNNPIKLFGVQGGASTDSILTITSGTVKKLPMGNGTAGLWSVTGNTATTANNFFGTTDNTGLHIRTNNAERVTIDSAGQVGIGTSAPTALLQVTGNNPIKLFGVQGGASTDSVLTITSGTIKKLPMGNGTAGLWSLTGNTATTGTNFFGTIDNVSLRLRTNNTQRVIIDSAGQVGIGTSTPTAPLQVYGNNPLKLFGVQGGSSTDSVLTITSGMVKKLPMGNGTAGLWSLTGNTATTATNFFGTTDNVSLRLRTNNTQRAIIDSTGKVGIGTSAPAATLDVSGTVKLGTNGNTFTNIVVGSATISVSSIAPSSSKTATATVSGAQLNGIVHVSPRASLGANVIIAFAYVSNTDQVTMSFATTNGTHSFTNVTFDIEVLNP